MNAKARPSLTSLSDRFARKEQPPGASLAPAEAPATATAPAPEAKEGRVQVLVRMTLAERKALRRIALERDTTVQALAEETLRDLLRRHGAM